MSQRSNLFQRAGHCIQIKEPSQKLEAVQRLVMDWHAGRVTETGNIEHIPVDTPGTPEKLKLVHPSQVKRRRLGSEEGRIALLHAIAHIEFSAINLALDAVQRFKDMPPDYYSDWLKVAAEECYHFRLLQYQLNYMRSYYGDLPAHQGLWDVALYSADDVLKRMALVPRVLEARGLDVTPSMIERVSQVGDERFVDILKIILRDEVGHVATGSRWFKSICQQRGLNSEDSFREIIDAYKKDMNAHIQGPFEHDMRRAAGFSAQELAQLAP